MPTAPPILLFPVSEEYGTVDKAFFDNAVATHGKGGEFQEVSRDVFLKWCVFASEAQFKVTVTSTDTSPGYEEINYEVNTIRHPAWNADGVPPIAHVTETSLAVSFQIFLTEHNGRIGAYIYKGKFYITVQYILYRHNASSPNGFFGTAINTTYVGYFEYTGSVEITEDSITITASRVGGDPGFEITSTSVATYSIINTYN